MKKSVKESRITSRRGHQDGEVTRHRDGSLTVWVAVRADLARAIGQGAKAAGVTRGDFMMLAAKEFLERRISLAKRPAQLQPRKETAPA